MYHSTLITCQHVYNEHLNSNACFVTSAVYVVNHGDHLFIVCELVVVLPLSHFKNADLNTCRSSFNYEMLKFNTRVKKYKLASFGSLVRETSVISMANAACNFSILDYGN